MANKTYIVEIELDPIEFTVTAKSEAEARKKAVEKLAKKNPKSLIKRDWKTNKRVMWVDEKWGQ